MNKLRFDNSFTRELPGDSSKDPRSRQVHGALFSRVQPTPVALPTVVAYSREVATLLGLSPDDMQSEDFAQVFGGNRILEGMEPYAANYGGHQFGQWAGQLGDGRAISLGEILNAEGERWELQLKGAGRTPYSRTADGRAVLRSSVREFLCSEAMHHLGVPTTRALSLVVTGEQVVRDMFYDGRSAPEPGAVVCRVAPSFIRFGNFELPASRGDIALLKQLADYTMRQHFPAIAPGAYAGWFTEVCDRTAVMIAHWMRVGFVHGVMNTDNLSILGLTIDYGPYGWIDNFDFDWTPNTTDAHGRRYRFGQQPAVALWNLSRLANALAPLVETTDVLQAGLERFADVFMKAQQTNVAAKLGLLECDEEAVALMHSLYTLMQEAEVDMTLFFRALGELNLDAPVLTHFDNAFYDEARRQAAEPQFNEWLARYVARARQDALPAADRRARMHAVNPRYVLRNYLAQQVIDRAEQGDYSGISELLDVMRRPYDDQPGRESFAQRRPDWARNRAGCSMLSCSS